MEALYKTAHNFSKPSAEKALVTEYKDRIKTEAEELVLKHFPQKILDLESLVRTDKFSRADLCTVHAELNIPVPEVHHNSNDINDQVVKKRKIDHVENDVQGTKVLVLPNGIVPCNKHIVELVDIAKPCIRQLVEDANVLKMWIQFLIPRIEDGNNFGVSIQEETLSEIRTVESDGATFFDQISRYFMTRAKIVSKVAKYPHVEDYRRTIKELDEKEFVSIRLVLCEIRNHYSTLHDMITKNMEKIKRPRSSNAENMY